MADKTNYHEIKDEIVRVVESGLMGKGTTAEEEKGKAPMDMDKSTQLGQESRIYGRPQLHAEQRWRQRRWIW